MFCYRVFKSEREWAGLNCCRRLKPASYSPASSSDRPVPPSNVAAFKLAPHVPVYILGKLKLVICR